MYAELLTTFISWKNFKDDDIRQMLLGARSLLHFQRRRVTIEREIGDFLENVVNRSLNIHYGEGWFLFFYFVSSNQIVFGARGSFTITCGNTGNLFLLPARNFQSQPSVNPFYRRQRLLRKVIRFHHKLSCKTQSYEFLNTHVVLLDCTTWHRSQDIGNFHVIILICAFKTTSLFLCFFDSCLE
ncbi:hypothetical protein DICVIV_11477 [Dictyocaulus viviparus]|uniref:Uncharacterized protein n=1 Tax=Dictyocaulus viviparus TaxID=29172 RepID=A0A0D8XFP5_DICVI|nr:hypothetical protein DICVIV_11477 [Dictyocaulus viviparus]